MKRCNVLKKCFAVMMSLALLLTMIPTSVFAETTDKSPVIDGSKTGTLTINKYDSNYDANDVTKQYPIGDVEFTLYKLLDINTSNGELEYSINKNFESFFYAEKLTVEQILAMDGEELEKLYEQLEIFVTDNADNVGIASQSQTTEANGKAVFSDLSLGYYFVMETDYPDLVVTPSAPFLVSIPMTNNDGTSWMYEVTVNPKNVTSTTDNALVLLKYGKEGETLVELPGAGFKLVKYNEKTKEWDTVEAKLVTDNNGKIYVTNLTRGQYKFIETLAPEGFILDKTADYKFNVEWDGTKLIYTDVDGNVIEDATIEVTNEKPTIDKVVDGDLSANIGDTVSWKVTTTVPSTIKDLKTFTITDTLSDGLTYTADSLVVTHNGKTLVKDTDYTLSVEGQVIKVILVPAKLTALKDVVVTYKTKLNENAVVGTDGNKNDVVLDYSTSTGTDSETKQTKPETDPKVYTFGLKLTKNNNAGGLLNGAEFKLCNKETEPKCKTLTTTDGVINFTGLATGEYVLTEVKAPTGYNLLKSPIVIKITPTYKDNGKELTVTATADSKDLNYNNETGYFEITVLNNKGFQLPATGGMGTVIFIIGGLSLMALAGGAYVASKRKESR
ncbi:SpaH/EbpB family LPXTG-anchored major pilin [Turicibacter sanguinis]|uniref:SpaH/EbpB family LPXTG-anchored major pilin n=1 Tax=Turicibacter sanguinis TaxID=154288 RepID=UPI00189C1BE7|nr:SpaH/EbpB family LPXTG-anchored major pilin [Turicibacter sanguinis]